MAEFSLQNETALDQMLDCQALEEVEVDRYLLMEKELHGNG